MHFARTPDGWERNNAAIQMSAVRLLGALNVMKHTIVIDQPLTFDPVDLHSMFEMLAAEADALLEVATSI